MALSLAGAAAVKQRRKFRDEFWPKDLAWEGPDEVGYFCAPRSLPLVLQVLGQKRVSGSKNPSSVYLDLLACHLGQGVVDLKHQEDHAQAAGYSSIKAWRERIKILESAGFIKTFSKGNRTAKIFLVHPAIAMKELFETGRVSKELWDAYRARQIESKELSADEIRKARIPASP